MHEIIQLLTSAAIKSVVVLLIACAAVLFMWRRSAAARHLVWTSAVAGVLLLPLFSLLLPGWRAVPVTSVVEGAVTAGPDTVRAGGGRTESSVPGTPWISGGESFQEQSRGRVSAVDEARSERGEAPVAAAEETIGSGGGALAAFFRWAPWVWLGGAVFSLLPLCLGWAELFRLGRTARPVGDSRWTTDLEELKRRLNIRRRVMLLESPVCGMPMTWGAMPGRAATILVPNEAVREWSDGCRRAVLLHELAHVKRWDCLTQIFTQLACAWYWFNPLIWLASHRMLVERERACDDLALRGDVNPPEYAKHLLAVAVGRQLSFVAAHAGIPMANRSRLGDRVGAILDRKRDRNALSRLAIAVTVALLGAVVVPIAMLEAEAGGEQSQTEEPVPERAMAGERSELDFRAIDGGTGQPVAGAILRVQDPHGIRNFETDAGGRYKIPLRADSSLFFWVRVWADGFVPMRVLWRDGPGEPPIPGSYTLELEPGTAIGGRVIDDAGEPVPGATVALHVHAQNDRPRESIGIPYTAVETGEDGRWEYLGAPAEFDRIQIGVRHPDYASHDRRPGSPMAGSYPMNEYHPIYALRDGSAEHVLERGIPVEVVVLDARGEPAEGASIGIGFDRFASNLVPERRTGADGRVRVAVHPDDELILTAKYAGHAPQQVRFSRNNLPEEVTFQLSRGHLLRGRVVDGEGEPVARARVSVDTWQGTRTLQARFVTDENGWFEWSDAPEDTVLVDVLAFGYADRRDVAVVAGGENRIELTSPLVVRGEVVHARTGEPVRGFDVDLGMIGFNKSSGTRSIASWENDPKRFEAGDGRFEIAPRTSYWAVRVVADGYQVAESPIFSAADGDRDLAFELEPEQWITGQVVDFSGRGVADAEVILAPRRASFRIENGNLTEHSRGITFQAMTDAAGRFAFPPQDGPFFLIALHETGYGELAGADFADSGSVALQPWGRIEGVLDLPDSGAGQRITCNYIRLFERSDSVRHANTALTTSDGRFVFDRVPPGEVVLARMAGSGSRIVHPNTLAIEVKPGETARATLGGPGMPVVGRISLEDLEGVAWRAGSSQVEKLPDGTIPDFVETMSLGDRRQWRAEWLSSEEGMAFNEARQRAFLMRIGDNFVVERDGSFRIENLEAGDYWLSLNIMGDRPDADGVFRPIAWVSRKFRVPEAGVTPGIEPHDLGVIEIEGGGL